jgi:hypothetical protein
MLTFALALLTSFGFAAGATAQGTAVATTDTSSTSSTAKLATIISRGTTEITRRLGTLTTLNEKLSSATELTTNDKATLSTEITNEISGLTALKTTLDSETTVAAATVDAENIFSEYRVYALITPQVLIIKTADDQQATQAKLSSLATALSSHLTSQSSPAIQADLVAMASMISSAHAISSVTESSVITLTPADYNTSHTILSGNYAQLKIAQTDDTTAATDAQAIITSLAS